MPLENEVGAVVRAVRDHGGADDAVTYQPLYLALVGRYYGLDYESGIRPEWGLPEGARFDRAWVVAAHPSALPTYVVGLTNAALVEHRFERVDRFVSALAQDYGVPHDPWSIRRRFQQGSIAVAVDEGGVRVLGPE